MTMESWPNKRMDDLCEVTSSKRIYAEELTPFGVPFYRSKEIIEKLAGQTTHSSPLFISEERFQQILLLTGAPREGDLLLTSRGTLGVPFLVTAQDRFHFADGNLTWFKNFKELDSSFLKYYFLSAAGKAELAKCVIGSSQQAYTITALKRMTVPAPPLATQRSVAGILSTYDEMIANNQLRIAVLEQIARALYREWFVYYRGFGARNPTGSRVPEGWTQGRFDDLVSIERASRNPQEYPDDVFEHYSIPAFDDGTMPSLEKGSTIKSVKYCVDSEAVLLSKLNPRIPRVWLPDPKDAASAIGSSEFLVLKGRNGISREFMYGLCTSESFKDQFGSLAVGTSTSHQRVKPESLMAISVVVPERRIVARYTEAVRPILSLMNTLRLKTANLRRTRDLLLPRLMSGRVGA